MQTRAPRRRDHEMALIHRQLTGQSLKLSQEGYGSSGAGPPRNWKLRSKTASEISLSPSELQSSAPAQPEAAPPPKRKVSVKTGSEISLPRSPFESHRTQFW